MSIRYTLASKDGDIVACARCDSEAPTAAVDDNSGVPQEHPPRIRMCKFCYETELGRKLEPGAVAIEQFPVLRCMAQIANILYWTESRYVEREDVK